jgi:diguanylate cyclase (GGDEF)-like protein
MIVRRVLLLASFVGPAIILPTVLLAFSEQDLLPMVVACLAYAAVFVLRSFPSGRVLQAALAVELFLIGSFSIAHFGNLSSGEAWFCAATMLSSFTFGSRGAAISWSVQAIILLALGLAQLTGIFSWSQDALRYALASIEGLGISLFVGAAMLYLRRGLRNSIEARVWLASELNLRQDELDKESACREDAEQRADFLERHDPLTRLPLRECFELELERGLKVATDRGTMLGIMAVGVDRFSRVSELHGPGAGDAILIEIGGRLTRSFRDGNQVARSSGDVFLVILSDMKSPDEAKEGIDKARRAFDRSFNVEGTEVGLSASFGIALFPNDGAEASSLIRASEAALLMAKRDGPGSYRLYDAVLHQRLLAATSVEGELIGALRAEAFLPWYQPKVDVLGRIIGAEALARWRLPDGSFRQPADFIAAAERSGFIVDLGRTVLAKACAAAASWERKGLEPVPVSVNLSPFQFRSDDLVKDIRRVLGATGLPASRLDLEITESGIMEDQTAAIEKLAELKALGCCISIDDFGTGYSSFATLRDYPVDMVKLPQAFVAPLPCDERASTIAGAVIDLAHKLRFSVVAEGVENERQFAWLGAASCDQYQGFLFARPMPEEHFEAALARGLGATVE